MNYSRFFLFILSSLWAYGARITEWCLPSISLHVLTVISKYVDFRQYDNSISYALHKQVGLVSNVWTNFWQN